MLPSAFLFLTPFYGWTRWHLTGLSLVAWLLAALFGPVQANPAAKTVQNATALEKTLVAFSQDDMTNDWRYQQVMDLKAHLADRPDIDFIYRDAGGSTAVQMQQIKQLVSQGIDILVVSPRESRGVSLVVKEAYEAGIKVILQGRKINYDTYTTFIAPDNNEIARQAATFFNEQWRQKAANPMPHGGTLLMLSGVAGNSVTQARTQAFIEHLDTRYQVVEKRADFIRSKALIATDQWLRQGKRFDAIYAQSDSMAIGARLALKKHGIDPASVLIVGIDYIQAAKQALLTDAQDVSFTYPTGGQEGAEVIKRLIDQKPVPKQVTIDHQKVTSDNANQVEPIF